MSIPWTYENHHNHFIDLSSTIAAGVSLVLCLFVLLAAWYIWQYKSARAYLDRISFRLSLWAMGAQVLQDIVYIALYAPTHLVDPRKPGCGAGVLFRLALLGIVNYLFTCVALNLMLTIVLGVNPIERHLERYYVGVSIFLGIIIPTIPACLGHFGYDPIFDTCYFTTNYRVVRVRHFVLDLYLWQSLSCLIATVSVMMVLYKLFRQSRATQRLASFETITSGNTDDPEIPCPHTSKAHGPLRRLLTPKRTPEPCGCACPATPEQPSAAMYQLQDKLKSVALRISLYPVALIVVNTIVTTGDLYTAVDQGIHSAAVYHMTVFHRLLCGGRGVVFAALCILVDPCLYRGFRAVLKERKKRAARRESERQRRARQDQENEKAAQRPPILNYASYSPTFIPPGETPAALLEDPLKMPQPMFAQSGPSVPEPWNEKSQPTRQHRIASDASMDFAQALGAAGSFDSGKQRPSAGSLDFMSALGISPNGSISPVSPKFFMSSAPPSRQNSKALAGTARTSMDVATALAMAPPEFESLDTVPSGSERQGGVGISIPPAPRFDGFSFASQPASAGISPIMEEAPDMVRDEAPATSTPRRSIPDSPRRSDTRDRQASTAPMDLDEILALGPPASRSPSATSIGLQSILAASPSRLNSTVSMDIDTVLAMGPLPPSQHRLPPSPDTPISPLSLRFHPQMSTLRQAMQPEGSDGSTSSGDLRLTPVASHPSGSARRPSLPQRWKDAFDEEEVRKGEEVEKTMRIRRTEQRRAERAKREWMRDLEKLYEEAESQL